MEVEDELEGVVGGFVQVRRGVDVDEAPAVGQLLVLDDLRGQQRSQHLPAEDHGRGAAVAAEALPCSKR